MDVLDLVERTPARHFVIHLDAATKHEYVRKVHELYRMADVLLQRLRIRNFLWMSQKNAPGTFYQVWELTIADPSVSYPTSKTFCFCSEKLNETEVVSSNESHNDGQ